MLQAALRSGAADRQCTFEVFARRLPQGRRFGVVAGTGRVLEGLESFRFGRDELDFLAERGIVDDATLDFLAHYRFGGDITGYAEGEIYVPNSPVLQVTATFAEACLLETFVLSVLNHDSAIASAGARMVMAAGGAPDAGGRPCVEMGSRRTHEFSATAAARAAAVVGFSATSNLEAGRSWGVPTLGTAAHAFTLLHDTEEEAFTAQVETFGPGTTLLVDTYDVESAVRKAAEIAGPELGAVRLDSGDLVAQAHEVRKLLDSLGNTETRIIVSSDLDEFAIAGLAAAPVDAYGVGTRLVTGSGAPTASMVYKLVQRQNSAGAEAPVEKSSPNKASAGGRKQAVRGLDDDGCAEVELIAADRTVAETGYSGRELQTPLVIRGIVQPGHTGQEGVLRAAQQHRASLEELPAAAQRLSEGEPVIPTVFV
ncbi:nicotinate phosphoribosyltransferase [Nesterenkonia salmonea]|uniref:Nicotinate phosphoribosyltransferase n=1 Tax=Nesterenkonia salmonea TaxID=1804987 RepID=A0A5R9BN82_9MICC|nr:nicotinate phosphoribosyltransferase [Nesterenkonia salmonea]